MGRRIRKALAFLGTVTATGLVGAAGLALVYAPGAQGLRDRLRASYEELRSRMRGEWGTPSAGEESATEVPEPDAAVTREHALEHGVLGRARAAEASRRPPVGREAPSDATLHPFRARRHA
jgi:hypothetical protein